MVRTQPTRPLDSAGSAPAWFDAHMHVFDPRFPMTPNAGFLPEPFTAEKYLARVSSLPSAPIGGAVVSASTQGFDQSYLRSALARLGPGWVGVTQLPATVADDELLELDRVGVRAVRFNLYRGGGASLGDLEQMARRIHDVAGWHVELYVDSRDLPELRPLLTTLPKVCIDHLGLFRDGLPGLVELAREGARVKASGFMRADFPPEEALLRLHEANPECLVFGTDIPNPRAPRPFADDDFALVLRLFGFDDAARVLRENALALYRPSPR